MDIGLSYIIDYIQLGKSCLCVLAIFYYYILMMFNFQEYLPFYFQFTHLLCCYILQAYSNCWSHLRVGFPILWILKRNFKYKNSPLL